MYTNRRRRPFDRGRGQRRPTELDLVIPAYCTLSSKGYCQSLACPEEAHNGIKMDYNWIRDNLTFYVLQMLDLQYKTGRKYAIGLKENLPNFKQNLKSLDLDAVADMILKNDMFDVASILVDVIPGIYDRIFRRVTPFTNRRMIAKLKIFAKKNRINLSVYPAFKEIEERQSVFFLIHGGRDKPRQDSYYLAVAAQVSQSNKELLYEGLCKRYGSDYPLCEKIRIQEKLKKNNFCHETDTILRNRAIRQEQILPSPDAYHMPSTVNVMMVNSIVSLRKAISEMEMELVLGWDCEWFSMGRDYIPHTIQIASASKVWLIDGVWLDKGRDKHYANQLFEHLFTHAEQCNIFLGKEDLLSLKRFKNMSCWNSIPGTVDLAVFCKQIGMKETSLANYTAFFLKQELDKHMTMSDWSHRPLSYDEITYAATDAYVTRLCFVKCCYMLVHEISDSVIKRHCDALLKANRDKQGKYILAEWLNFKQNPTKATIEMITNVVSQCEDFELCIVC